jgi:hypothetical protein
MKRLIARFTISLGTLCCLGQAPTTEGQQSQTSRMDAAIADLPPSRNGSMNARTLGAKADGTDDSQALQSAINAAQATPNLYSNARAGTVFLPDGHYTFSRQLRLGSCRLVGNGRESTILHYIGSDSPSIICSSSNAWTSAGKLEHLTIEATGNTNTVDAFGSFLNGSESVQTIHDVTISHFANGTAITADALQDAYWDRILIQYCRRALHLGGHGFHPDMPTNEFTNYFNSSLLSRLTIFGCTDTNFVVWANNTSELTFEQLTFLANNSGIIATNYVQFAIRDSYFEANCCQANRSSTNAYVTLTHGCTALIDNTLFYGPTHLSPSSSHVVGIRIGSALFDRCYASVQSCLMAFFDHPIETSAFGAPARNPHVRDCQFLDIGSAGPLAFPILPLPYGTHVYLDSEHGQIIFNAAGKPELTIPGPSSNGVALAAEGLLRLKGSLDVNNGTNAESGTIRTSGNGINSFYSDTYSDTSYYRPEFHLRRARGTETNPAPVQPFDWLGAIVFDGYSSNGWVNAGYLRAYARGAITSPRYVPLGLALYLGNGVQPPEPCYTFDSSGLTVTPARIALGPVTLTSGKDAPTSTEPDGSLYLKTDGSMWIRSNRTWVPK